MLPLPCTYCNLYGQLRLHMPKPRTLRSHTMQQECQVQHKQSFHSILTMHKEVPCQGLRQHLPPQQDLQLKGLLPLWPQDRRMRQLLQQQVQTLRPALQRLMSLMQPA